MLVDALHHAREHLTTEQALALLRWLTRDYGTDETVTRLVDTREVFIIFALNPDGMRYDLTGAPYRAWRKNLPARRRREGHVHGPQPQLRVPLGMLPRVVGQADLDHVSRPGPVLRARDAGPARLRQRPRGGRRPADPDPRHAPHQRAAHPVAVRLHEDQRPVRHDGARPRGPGVAGARDGGPERLRRQAVVRPLHHRRRPDRLDVREVPDLLVHLRAVPDGEGHGLGRPLPGRFADRCPDRAQPEGAAPPHRPRRLPVRRPGRRLRGRRTAGRCSTTWRSTAAGSATPPARTPRPRAAGRSATRSPRRRAGPSSPGRRSPGSAPW